MNKHVNLLKKSAVVLGTMLIFVSLLPGTLLAYSNIDVTKAISSASVAVASAEEYSDEVGAELSAMQGSDLSSAKVLLLKAGEELKKNLYAEAERLASSAEDLALCVEDTNGPLCGLDQDDSFWIEGKSATYLLQQKLIVVLGDLVIALQKQINFKEIDSTEEDAQENVDVISKVDPVTESDHIKGNISAPIKIIVYSDFECPFCKIYHETLGKVTKKFDSDQIALVFRQFPLEELHRKALPVAMASECVAELGGNEAFWKFTDGYFAETLTNDKTDIETVIPKLVSEAGVNKKKFNDCLDSNKHRDLIDADIADAFETGGRGTPWSIIIGPSGKKYPVNGSQPLAEIEKIIQTALDEG